MADQDVSGSLGIYVYGLASFAAGMMDFIWGDFDSSHQPIQAWGDHIPGLTFFAYVTALWMTAGGLAILWRRSAKLGAAALAIIYLIFAVFWLPRFSTAPRYLGFHLSVYIGVFAGIGTELIAFAGGLLAYSSISKRDLSRQPELHVARWIFGLCSIGFGLSHLNFINDDIIYVPQWMPLGGKFWVVATGICFVLAGVAILSGVQDVLAARLLALMLLGFNFVALPQFIIADPKGHAAWGGSAYNLAAAAATWILASSLTSHRRIKQTLVRPTLQ
jgi:uncharacterized membrane protein YphA (DoxX/SURF4 family)